jgi:4-hydroxythreonine-4-phosphate dehydrogenase
MTTRPRIAITMGDAAGVGPEVILKALAHRELYAIARPLVVGDARRLGAAGRIVGSALVVSVIAEPEDARFEPGAVDCIDLGLVPEATPFGKLSTACGGPRTASSSARSRSRSPARSTRSALLRSTRKR